MHAPTVFIEQKADLSRRWRFLFSAFFCLAIGAAVSVHLGQDANWDLRNYHLYIGYAALHGRETADLAAAGLQSWLNPTLDIPYAWLALGALAQHPKLLSAFMGLWYGLLIWVTLVFAATLYRGWPAAERWFAAMAGTALAASGAAVISQVGTTLNDIQIATLVIAAVLLTTTALETDERNGNFALFSAGALFGCAAGLKVTSVIYGPAACLALVGAMPARRWVRAGFFIGGGAILGLAAGGGWWFWMLWKRFGNPVFPFFNGIFRSAWYPATNYFDHRFLPQGIWQTLFFPFWWLSGHADLVTEVPFRDGRVAAALACGLIVLLLFFASPRFRTPFCALTPKQRFVAAFLSAAYVLWLSTTSILRYAIPVETCACLMLPLLLRVALSIFSGPAGLQAWRAVLTTASAALVLSTHYPDWVRVPYRSPVVAADMHWLPPHALVVLAGGTMSYIVPFAPRDTEFVGLTDAVYQARGYALANAMLRRVASHKGPMFVIWNSGGEWRYRALHDMGLWFDDRSCRTFFASYEFSSRDRLHACSAYPASGKLHDTFWKVATQHYRAIQIPHSFPGWSYASLVNAVGRSARGLRMVDEFNYLWAGSADDPRQFERHILPDTLYVLAPSLKQRAIDAAKPDDLLAEIDGLLVLAPRWKNCPACVQAGNWKAR